MKNIKIFAFLVLIIFIVSSSTQIYSSSYSTQHTQNNSKADTKYQNLNINNSSSRMITYVQKNIINQNKFKMNSISNPNINATQVHEKKEQNNYSSKKSIESSINSQVDQQSITTTSSGPQISNAYFSPDVISPSDTSISLSANVTDSSASISSVSFQIVLNQGSVLASGNMNLLSGETYQTTVVISPLSLNDVLNFSISASDSLGSSSSWINSTTVMYKNSPSVTGTPTITSASGSTLGCDSQVSAAFSGNIISIPGNAHIFLRYYLNDNTGKNQTPTYEIQLYVGQVTSTNYNFYVLVNTNNRLINLEGSLESYIRVYDDWGRYADSPLGTPLSFDCKGPNFENLTTTTRNGNFNASIDSVDMYSGILNTTLDIYPAGKSSQAIQIGYTSYESITNGRRYHYLITTADLNKIGVYAGFVAFYFTGSDTLNNVNHTTFTLGVDRVAPMVSFNSTNPTYPTKAGPIKLSFNAVDNFSAISTYSIVLKQTSSTGNIFGAYSSTNSTSRWSHTGDVYTFTIPINYFSQEPNNFYLYYEFMASDSYTNMNKTSGTILIDSDSPQVASISISPNIPTEIDNITVTADVTNSLSAIESRINNVTFVVYQNGFENVNNYTVVLKPQNLTQSLFQIEFNVSQVLKLQPGDILRIDVTAYDIYGNHNVNSIERTLADSDHTNPVVVSGPFIIPSMPTEKDQVNITVDLYDASGISSVNISVYDNGVYTNTYNFIGVGNGNNSISLLKYQAGHNISYVIEFVDGSLNKNSNSVSGFIVIKDSDVIPPVIQTPVQPIDPTEKTTINVTVVVTDSGSGVNWVKFHYELNNSGTWTSVNMTEISTTDVYIIVLQTYNPGTTIQYYIEAQDKSLNQNTMINDNGTNYFDIFIGDSDVSAPIISPNPPLPSPARPTEIDTINITVQITDASGVAWALLNYSTDNGYNWTSLSLTSIGNNYYSISFGPFTNGTQVIYFIEAQDNTINKNLAISSQNFFNVGINDVFPPAILNVKYLPLKPTNLDNLTVSAFISDDSGLYETSLYYSINNGSFSKISMVDNGSNIYLGCIGFYSPGTLVSIYIVAIDNSSNYNVAINNNLGHYYNITIGDSDVIGPTIKNALPTNEELFVNQSVVIKAIVNDSSGVNTVYVYYTTDGFFWTVVQMTFNGSYYTANLGVFTNISTIIYYFKAVDNSLNKNVNINNNNNSYYEISVLETMTGIIDVQEQIVYGYGQITIRIIDYDRNLNSNVYDSIMVNVTSDSYPKGILLTLNESLPNSGIFYGYLRFGRFTNTTINQIAVSNDNSVLISYKDPTDKTGNPLIVTKSLTWKVSTIAILQIDKNSYNLTDKAKITLIDGDININPTQKDNITVEVWSTADNTGFTLMLEETDINSAIFVGYLFFSDLASNSSNDTLLVTGFSIIYVLYVDKVNSLNYEINDLVTATIIKSQVSQEIVVNYFPDKPTNGDYLRIEVSTYFDPNISSIEIYDINTNKNYSMIPNAPNGDYLVYGYTLLAVLPYGKSSFSYKIQINYQNGTSWISQVYEIPLQKGELDLEWYAVQSQIQGAFNVSTFNKRHEYLTNVSVNVVGYNLNTQETVIIGTYIINGSYILKIDPDTLNLSPGRWEITLNASKYGYNSTNQKFYMDVTYGIEILPGLNVIDIGNYTDLNTSLILEINTDNHFWLVISRIDTPLITELNSEKGFRPINGSFFDLSIITLAQINGSLFNSFKITLDTTNYHVKARSFLLYFAKKRPDWIKLNLTYSEYTLEASLTELGNIGLLVSELAIFHDKLNTAPGFEFLSILSLMIILVWKKYKKRKIKDQ